MKLLFNKLFNRSRPASRPARPSSKLMLEGLESRLVPTITNHGGAVLPHVEVQAMYFGSDWMYSQLALKNTLDSALGTIVNSSYMDMLTNAGYGVGRGSVSPSTIYGVYATPNQNINDSLIQSDLVAEINGGLLSFPDSNRLYVVFMEDNVGVTQGSKTSQSNFLAYHGAFTGQVYGSIWASIHYAVVTYPGGTVNNAGRSWLGAQDTITLSASHEIAEAVTDPNVNYSTLGWYDDSLGGENGDINNAQTVYLNGYAVQRIPDLNDQAMTPAGATSIRPVNFILKNDGTLWESTGGSPFYIYNGVASISDQSIDEYGRAMVDIVSTAGYAMEYHEGLSSPWTVLWQNGSSLNYSVKSAKAGQGVSYVLYNDGSVYEYKDCGQGAVGQGATWTQLDSNVTAIDAGTDRYGVNMFAEVWYSQAWMHSDSTGWTNIASGVKAVSAGQQGVVAYLTTGGDAYSFTQSIAAYVHLGSGVAAVTAGSDQNGLSVLDMLYSNGTLNEWRASNGWTTLSYNIASIGKAHAGVEDAITFSGSAYAHTGSGYYGWSYLTNNANTAA
jgi:hypothetical protein